VKAWELTLGAGTPPCTRKFQSSAGEGWVLEPKWDGIRAIAKL
jgi:ATP-dependent DNA ligase